MWRNATNSLLQGGDDLDYKALFIAIREGNMNSDSSHQLRVLAGDPPVDWNAIHTKKDFYAYLNDRDRHYANVVNKELIDANKRGVMIMGRSHLTYTTSNPEHPNVINLLKNPDNAELIIIHLLTDLPTQISKMSIKSPSVIRLKNNWLGETNAKFGFKRKEDEHPPALKETIDAVLYLGDPETFSKSDLRVFDDDEYLAELNRRAQIIYESDYEEVAEFFGIPYQSAPNQTGRE